MAHDSRLTDDVSAHRTRTNARGRWLIGSLNDGTRLGPLLVTDVTEQPDGTVEVSAVDPRRAFDHLLDVIEDRD